MYAIIVTGGKQYRVEQGDIVYIEKLAILYQTMNGQRALTR